MNSDHSIKIIDHGFVKSETGALSGSIQGNPQSSLSVVVNPDDGVVKGDGLPVNNNVGNNTLNVVPPAVLVRNAVKSYGKKQCLRDLDMKVPQGEIYSLLGASGCGKTTLLTCILGIRNLSKGSIEVFGSRAGSRESGVPGPLVGYMPQEQAVYKKFSIGDTFRYFGSLNGMTNKAIREKTRSFIELLDLPSRSRTVGTLSGGQGRRLSLAIALIHSPRLIILDEPTVGVDPLLRERIWNHLVDYVKSNHATVIITTHYIDEARHSNTIGVMRDGKILVEQSPQTLYTMYNTIILEDIVLKLCHEDEMGTGNKKCTSCVTGGPDTSTNSNLETGEGDKQLPRINQLDKAKETADNGNFVQNNPDVGKPKKRKCCQYFCSDFKKSANRILTLIEKNTIVTVRNYLFMGFIMTFPSLVMIPLIMAIAGEPHNLNFAVSNLELPNSTTVCTAKQLNPKTCDMELVTLASCVFLGRLSADQVTKATLSYMNEKKALEQVKHANQHAMLSFPKNFTLGMMSGSSEYKAKNMLSVRIDESQPLIAKAIRIKVTQAYFDFFEDLKDLCKAYASLMPMPTIFFKFEKSVYGGQKDDPKIFAACGFLIGFTFFFGNISCALNLVWDKKQGTLERSQVNGVKTWEILFAQSITESALIIVQTSLTYFVLIVIYKGHNEGSHFLALCLLILSGIMGNAHGFLWAAISDEELNVELLSMAAYFPGYFLSGLNFPLESFPTWLRYIAYVLPTTMPSEGVRSVMFRGMGLSYPEVYLGFIGAFSWFAFMWIATIIVHAIFDRRR